SCWNRRSYGVWIFFFQAEDGIRDSAARRDRERKTGRAADSYSCRAAVRARGENRYAGRDTRVRAETEAGERGRDQDFRVAEHTAGRRDDAFAGTIERGVR